MMRKPKPIEFSFKDREGLLERLKQSNMPTKDTELLTGLIEFNLWLQHSLEEKKISINKLQKMFGRTSEKRKKQKKQGTSSKEENKTEDESIINSDDTAGSPSDSAENASANTNPESTTEQTTNIRKYVPNTGRLGHEAYTNAEIIFLSASCKAGDPCSDPNCKGRLKMVNPGNIIKVVGQSLAKANKYVLQTLRCILCERYSKAKLPDNVCSEKYDPAFKAQLCIHKYFLGVPNYRLEAYQQMLGVPLPDSTQIDKMEDVANAAHPAFKHLEKLAANGHLAHGDDTSIRIKSVIKANKTLGYKARKGTFTTGILRDPLKFWLVP